MGWGVAYQSMATYHLCVFIGRTARERARERETERERKRERERERENAHRKFSPI